MNLEIRGRNLTISAPLREHCEKRLQFALGRFSDQVARVSVRLMDQNGPRGGVDKSCQLTIHLRKARSIHIESVSDNFFAAVAEAADRASHAVTRERSRSRPTLHVA
ncbi:MAG TPA: ribosome-associated translation inhibitor RaiA [Myxococcaceae bacterium]|jgi:ribosomal subunit interface protein